jgi:hypothetical protein
MNPLQADSSPVGAASDAKDGATGLPWVRTWNGVYAIVISSFVLWVLLLLALTLAYS